MKIKKNVAISDSGFIFNPDTGESFTANPMAVEILEMTRDDKDRQDICEAILEKYNIDRVTLEKDYNDFIAMLQRFQLIQEYE